MHFLNQLEEKFHSFRWLKWGKEKIISIFFSISTLRSHADSIKQMKKYLSYTLKSSKSLEKAAQVSVSANTLNALGR